MRQTMYAHVQLANHQGGYPNGSEMVELTDIVSVDGKLHISTKAAEYAGMEVTAIVELVPYCQAEGGAFDCAVCSAQNACLRSRFEPTPFQV